jgi:hypothetical protein
MGYGTKDHIAGIMQYGICQWNVYPMVFANLLRATRILNAE